MQRNSPIQRMGSQCSPVTDRELLFGGVSSWELVAHHKVGKVGFLVQRKPSGKEMQMVGFENWCAVHWRGRVMGCGRHPQHLLAFWGGISITSGLFLRSELTGSVSDKTIHWTKGFQGPPSTLISTSLKSGFARNRVYWCLNNAASEELGTLNFLDSLPVLQHLKFQSSSVKL